MNHRIGAANRRLWIIGAAALLAGAAGCAVPQKPGHGLCSYLVEPGTQTGYWLYLPADYVTNNGRHPQGERWPLVVTLHGLRPYDDANPQIREWEGEGDRYNFIIIAPVLRTCDTLRMVPPLRNPNLPSLRQDEEAILRIMDEVIRRSDADPSKVLATSFSAGGYIAHYMVNQHSERFSCLVVRGSNFSESLLDPSQISRYRNMPVGIFFGENDFKLCADESIEAVEFYRRHRFNVIAKQVGGLGHERKPEVAAALFAATIGATPKTPPELGPLVMRDVFDDDAGRSPHSQGDPFKLRSAPGGQKAPVRASALFSPPAQSPPSGAEPASAARTGVQVMPTTPVQRTPTPIKIVPRRSETPKRPTAGGQVGYAAPRSKQRDQAIVPMVREEVGTSSVSVISPASQPARS